MALMAQYPDTREFRRQAEAVISLQFRLASPLWLAYGAAANLSVTWMDRWAAATKLKTLAGSPSVAAPMNLPAPKAVAVEPSYSEAVAEIDPVLEAVDGSASFIVQPFEAPIAAEATALDDLTRLVGIGPKVADALAARGVTQFAQLAAWTTDDLTKFDSELKLLGRGTRDAWIAQAKRLANES